MFLCQLNLKYGEQRKPLQVTITKLNCQQMRHSILAHIHLSLQSLGVPVLGLRLVELLMLVGMGVVAGADQQQDYYH